MIHCKHNRRIINPIVLFLNRVSIEELQKHTELDNDRENEFTVEEVRVCSAEFFSESFIFAFFSQFSVQIQSILMNLMSQSLNKYLILITN